MKNIDFSQELIKANKVIDVLERTASAGNYLGFYASSLLEARTCINVLLGNEGNVDCKNQILDCLERVETLLNDARMAQVELGWLDRLLKGIVVPELVFVENNGILSVEAKPLLSKPAFDDKEES